MTQTLRQLLLPAIVYLFIVIFALLNWQVQPEASSKWILVMLLFPVAVFSTNMLTRRSTCEGNESGKLNRTLAFAGSLLAFVLIFKLAETTLFMTEGQAGWIMTILVGGFFIFFGNNIPKSIVPLNAKNCSPAQYQALHRFIGWGFVLIGIANIGVHFFMPMEQADDVGRLIMWSGLAILALRSSMVHLSSAKEKKDQ